MVHPTSIALCTAALWTTAIAQFPQVLEPAWDDVLPDGRFSTQRQDIDFEEDLASPEVRRAFPIGNGIVFGCAELGTTANSTCRVRGVDESGWALDLRVHSTVQGRLEFPTQRIVRVRGSSCVVSEATRDTMVLRTATFAPAGTTEILHILEVEALAGRAVADPTESFWITVTLSSDPAASAIPITLDLGPLAVGTRWRGAVCVDFPEGSPTTPGLRTQAVRKAIEAARRHLDAEVQAPTSYATDHASLDDLLDAITVDLQALRHLDTGLVTTFGGPRDRSIEAHVGRMLVQLRFGLWDDAADLLRAVFRRTQESGTVPQSIAANWRPLPGARAVAWHDVEVIQGESPLWILLAHYWYWRATRDSELIRTHWPLLEVCLKRVDREHDDLLRMHPDEPWLTTASPAARKTAERGGFSFRAGALLLVGIQAFGELAGSCLRDEEHDAALRIERQFRNRMFRTMRNVERHYWIEDVGCFAPALRSDGTPIASSWSEANLFPSLIGWTFASGNRHARNVERWLTESDAGAVSAARIVAFAEREDDRTLTAVDRAIRLIAGGTHESGFLIDAVLFALTGIRHASVPDHDKTEIRLRPRLPLGATRFELHRHRKDGRDLSMKFDERMHWLSLDEERVERDYPPARRHDPRVRHRRLHIHVELHAGEQVDGRPFQVALQTDETLLLRWLSMGHGATHRRIEECVYLSTSDRGTQAPSALGLQADQR